jgi:hypothetical protein
MNEIIQLMSVNDMVDLTAASENLDRDLLAPFIQNATIMYIVPAIGEAMYSDMQLDISTGGTKYQDFKENYLFYALSWYSLYNGLPFIHAKIMKKGVLLQHSDDSENVSIDVLGVLIKRVESIAISYTNRMRDYLETNKTLYPLYRGNVGCDDESRSHGNSVYLPRSARKYNYNPSENRFI